MKKMKISKLKISSFITEMQKDEIKGGSSLPSANCTLPPGCPDPRTTIPTTSHYQEK